MGIAEIVTVSGVSLYPVLFNIRQFFFGPKTVTIVCHCNRCRCKRGACSNYALQTFPATLDYYFSLHINLEGKGREILISSIINHSNFDVAPSV